MRTRPHTRRLRDYCRTMPALRHQHPGQPFSWQTSDVARWLCTRPELPGLLFRLAHNAGAIRYDAETGTWRGRGEG